MAFTRVTTLAVVAGVVDGVVVVAHAEATRVVEVTRVDRDRASRSRVAALQVAAPRLCRPK